MEKKEIIYLIFLALIIILLSVLIYFGQKTEKIEFKKEESTIEQFLTQEEQGEKTEVTIFFPSEEDSLLHPEKREIYLTPSLTNRIKQVIFELIKGSENGYLPSLPSETKLREVFVTEEGIAYIDFSKEIYQQHPGGSQGEIISVYAIVNSLIYNFPEIKKVKILIEGLEKETLNGHIDLTKPFSSRLNLIAFSKNN